MRPVLNVILIAYLTAAGITWVQGDKVGQGLQGRVALPDLLMCLLGLLVVVSIPRLKVSSVMLAATAYVVYLCLRCLAARPDDVPVIELAVHAFLAAGYLVIFNLMACRNIDERIKIMTWWLRGAAVLAAIGIWDLFASAIGGPMLGHHLASWLGSSAVDVNTTGGVVSTFRNTGQAGTYFSVVLCMAIPLPFIVKGRRRSEAIICALVLFLGLLLSVKRAALVGIFCGVLFLLLRVRLRYAAAIASIVLMGVGAVVFLASPVLVTSEAFTARVERKLIRLGEASASSRSDFLSTNLDAAQKAFCERPLFGMGHGMVRVRTDLSRDLEVHSTYLRVLSEGGLVGLTLYTLLMGSVVYSMVRCGNSDPRVNLYAKLFVPLLAGLMISWCYTYHLRKREFWIAAALATGLAAPCATVRAEDSMLLPPRSSEDLSDA